MTLLGKVLEQFFYRKRPAQASHQPVVTNTIKDIKSWVDAQLPPLAWNRIVVRLIRYCIQNYQKTLDEFEPNTKLSAELSQKIQTTIFELYQVKVEIRKEL
ncbi:MAG: hypothetical protein NZ519_13750 [Bacteroidia bacterium]|nr:hypothetical protein [Bacteroidia bacterium]MDW8303046.1 hypothetical protein [Bacteroidia bacterium]